MAKIGEIAKKILGMSKTQIINQDFPAPNPLASTERKRRRERLRKMPTPRSLQTPEKNILKRLEEKIGDIFSKSGH